jgi:hypothetical protein
MKEKKRLNVKIAAIAFLLIAVLILYFVDYPAEEKTLKLSELQTVACEVADEAGTCNSRLPDLGIVLQEECCQALGKCCG